MKITKVMRIISALTLIYSIYLILENSPKDVWVLNYTYTCFYFVRTSILFYLHVFLFYLSLLPTLFVHVFTQGSPTIFYVSQQFLDKYFQTTLNASTMQTDINIETMIKPAYIFLTQTIIFLMLISLILFLFKCDFSNALKIVLFEGTMLFLYKLGEFLKIIAPVWQESFLSSESIVSFAVNPLILNILLIYLSFDLAVQASYVQNVFSFKTHKFEFSRQQRENISKEKEAKVTFRASMVRRFLTSDVVQYLREIVEKRGVHEKQEAKTSMDSTRLQVFLENLYQMDPEAKTSLEAKATPPSEAKTLISILLSTMYRAVTVILLSYFIIHPRFLFAFLDAPPAIIGSLELSQPEAMLLVLLPLLFTITLIGLLIPTRKDKIPSKR